MEKFLNTLLSWMARVHNYILSMNDSFETNFSDKELHFLVIGALGLGLILLVYPLFKLRANHNRVLASTWIYVLTVLVVVTFAIEIGQYITGSGTMEFGDVVAGMGGFFAVTAVITSLHLLLWIIRTIAQLIREAGRREDGRGRRATKRSSVCE